MLFISIWMVFYYLINAHFSQYFARYMVPLIPIICLAAGHGWKTVRDKLSNRKFILSIVNIAVLLSVIIPTIQSDILFASKDTRTMAKEWIEVHLPSQAGIALSSRAFSPRLRQTDDQIREKLAGEDLQNPSTRVKRQLQLIQARRSETPYRTHAIAWEEGLETLPYFSIQPIISPDLTQMVFEGIEYLVLDYQEFNNKVESFLKQNQHRLELIQSFSPYTHKNKKISVDPYDSTALPHAWTELFSRIQSGPYLEIYRIRKEGV